MNDESPLDDASVVIVIRAWHERHPDAPFRAVITTQAKDEAPVRQKVASIEDALSAIRARLDGVASQNEDPERGMQGLGREPDPRSTAGGA